MNLQDTPLYFVGDHHGSWNYIFDIIKKFDIKNCHLIHVGDGGEGFVSKQKQMRLFNQLNDFFQSHNIFYKSIRGNHSDPSYFMSPTVNMSHFALIEDYTVANYRDKTIQFIGGAISIDRVARVLNASYWEDEGVNLYKDKCQKVDILLTHTAPSWCFPQRFNNLVYDWALRDAYLLDELTDERAAMDQIFKICQPQLHLYGHFHSSHTEIINECTHKLLDINEFWELKL
jgi:UDP-2,3-diacylglucosamine pyrophosphatase LpxH